MLYDLAQLSLSWIAELQPTKMNGKQFFDLFDEIINRFAARKALLANLVIRIKLHAVYLC